MGHSVSIQQMLPAPPSKILIKLCINVLEHALKNFAAIFSVFFFWQNFKEVWGDPVYCDLQIAS